MITAYPGWLPTECKAKTGQMHDHMAWHKPDDLDLHGFQKRINSDSAGQGLTYGEQLQAGMCVQGRFKPASTSAQSVQFKFSA